MLLALFLRLFLISQVQVILPDEAYYIRTAQEQTAGRSAYTYSVEHRAHPMTMLLFRFAMSFGGDPVYSCEAASAVMGVLLLLPFHGCVRMFGSRLEALFADSVYAIAPFCLQFSLWAMTHALFNFFFICLLWSCLKAQASANLRYAVVGGIAVWGAYMTRVEAAAGALILGIGGLLLPWLALKEDSFHSRLKLTLIFWGAFLFLSSPFWMHIRWETGSWSLTSSWTHASGATGILASKWKNNTFVLSQYIHQAVSVFLSLPKILPCAVWGLLGLGAMSILHRDSAARKKICLVLFFALLPLVFYPLGSTEGRMIHPALVALMVFAGPGLVALRHAIRTIFFKLDNRGALALCLSLLLLVFAHGYVSLYKGFNEEPQEQKYLGLWMKENLGKGHALLGSDRRSVFYGDASCRKFVSLADARRQASENETPLDIFLKEEGVDLVALDTRYIPKYYPEYLFLLENPPERWQALKSFDRDGESITLYKVSAGT